MLEGRLPRLGLDASALGTDVVVDFGCWSRDERSAIRRLARAAGASCRIEYLSVDRTTQLDRIAHRQATAPEETLPMDEADILRGRALFEEPDHTELGGHEIDGPPPGWPGWPEWASHRWPSLT
ncbi:AAA family ATPase [Streptomyces sp. NPDC002092]